MSEKKKRAKGTRSNEKTLTWEPTEEVALLGKRVHYLSLPEEVRSVIEVEGNCREEKMVVAAAIRHQLADCRSVFGKDAEQGTP